MLPGRKLPNTHFCLRGLKWAASSEFGTYRLCEQRRFRRACASVQRIRAVSPEPSLLAHTSSESRGTFRQKARSLAPLNGWACAVKICHDGMLEDTNSLDGAQMISAYLTETLHSPVHQHSQSRLGGVHILRHRLVLARVSLQGPQVGTERVEVLLLFRHLLLENCDHFQQVLEANGLPSSL